MTIVINKIPEINELVRQVQNTLTVHCILCVGSYAVGLQDEKSDIDLLVICDEIPSEQFRKNLYSLVSYATINEISKDLSHWTPSWSPVNDTIIINSKKIEIGFNTDRWVKIVVNKLIKKHTIHFDEFPFRPYSFLGLLESCFCLYEKNSYYSSLKSEIRPFPIELKKEIVKSQWPILIDSYIDMQDTIDRHMGNLLYQHFIFMALDAIVELIWIINDVYSPASKRSEIFLLKLKNLPPDFINFINNSLPKCYEKRLDFIQQIEKIKNFIKEQLLKLNLIKIDKKQETNI